MENENTIRAGILRQKIGALIEDAYEDLGPDDVLSVIYLLYKQVEVVYMRYLMKLGQTVDEALDQPKH